MKRKAADVQKEKTEMLDKKMLGCKLFFTIQIIYYFIGKENRRKKNPYKLKLLRGKKGG